MLIGRVTASRFQASPRFYQAAMGLFFFLHSFEIISRSNENCDLLRESPEEVLLALHYIYVRIERVVERV